MTTMRGGVGGLWQRVTLWRPAAIVFVEHDDAVAAAGRPLAETWGHIPGVALSGRPCFLMPAPDADPEILDEALNFLRNLAASLPVDRP